MSLHLDYETYLDKIRGGWIGKSIGGAVGARYEGYKGWIEIDRRRLFPQTLPPNDDLDLQVLWLSVLEKKGLAVTSNDLADAWLDGCWYPFNEYGNFRRNYRLGIKPPYSGRFHNAFFDTGMGCPIRAEIWGYVFAGAPDLAARYAYLDGTLDHGEQSVGAEQMLAAMASMAFFISDIRRLIDLSLHHLPPDTTIHRLTMAALRAYDAGLTLRQARTRLLALEGHPEACDARLNVPFTLLGLLYGAGDMEKTLLSALRCGYDTDCTCATSVALVGQILGASRIPAALKDPIGDELVMGIAYHRPEMTLSALARDTARVGVLLGRQIRTGVSITRPPPSLEPLPSLPSGPPYTLVVDYPDQPLAVPGEPVRVQVTVEGPAGLDHWLSIDGSEEWEIAPAVARVNDAKRSVVFTLQRDPDFDLWSQKNLLFAELMDEEGTVVTETLGLEGAAPWVFLGAYFDPYPGAAGDPRPMTNRQAQQIAGDLAPRLMNHHFVDLDTPYIENEAHLDVNALYDRWSGILGRPALLYARPELLDIHDLFRLQGEYVLYLSQDVVIPQTRKVYLVVGHNDGYKLWVNGEQVGESRETLWWSPYNSVHVATLHRGENRIVIKLLKRGERLDFSLGVREWHENKWQNATDWHVDLKYLLP